MQSSILLIASVLAAFSQAAPQATPPSGEAAEIHIFDQESCTRAEITSRIRVSAKDTFKCTKFPSDKPVKSIWTKHLSEGCILETYSDLVCTMDRHDMSTKACLSGDKYYGSYMIVCN
ncbi:hypothetical protein NW752_007580 [Fusarium irregulare]|uniref:Uncharacterized protein n=1 Tax=Fusarium irregulare TaxID=2494466 RepID=A0A9W8U6L1_9HYPO|nr:hypothetical protein NW766_010123 [Fusarium irregulare]KAJ4013284.1 hypothetical protein NW752_007580 [Fusarium irregulare]